MLRMNQKITTALIVVAASVSANANANNQSEQFLVSNGKQLCAKKGFGMNTRQCADFIKQSQLNTEKLSPQIRSSEFIFDEGMHYVEFSAFVGGFAGQVK